MMQMQEILNVLNSGIVLIDARQRLVFFNHWIENKTGILLEMVEGEPLEEVFTRFRENRYQNILNSVAESNNVRFLSGAIHGTFFSGASRDDNRIERQNLSINSLSDGSVLIQVEDVSQQVKEQMEFKKFIRQLEDEKDSIKVMGEKERRLARTDALTGLNNRLALNGYLNRMLAQMQDDSEETGMVIYFIDMDDFKNVNDTFGHKLGDLVLKEAADRMNATANQGDFTARIAGDEFIVVVNGQMSEEEQKNYASKLCETLSRPFVYETYEIPMSASIGICNHPQKAKSIDDILEKADIALYRSKKTGKGRYTLFSESL